MLVMEKEKKEKKTGRPRVRQGTTHGGRSGALIQVRVDESLEKRLTAYFNDFNSKNPHTTRGAIVAAALDRFLAAEGFGRTE